jgi:hypothetical protein
MPQATRIGNVRIEEPRKSGHSVELYEAATSRLVHAPAVLRRGLLDVGDDEPVRVSSHMVG